MELKDIGLNRFLVKDSPRDSSFSYTSVYMAATVGSNDDDASVKSGTSAFDINQSSMIIRADKIEAQSIELTEGFVNTQLTSITLPANGVRVDFNGIYGRKAGETTFSLDVNGNAFFGGTISTADTGARVLIDDSNNISLFDDSTGGGGSVTGNSSEIRFIKSTQNTKYFTIQRRAGKDSNNDGVLEIYPTAPVTGGHNFIFIGRNGLGDQNTTGNVSLGANILSSQSASGSNGSILLRVTTNGNDSDQSQINIVDTRTFGSSSYSGVSSYLNATGADSVVGFFDSGISKFYYQKGLTASTGVYSEVTINSQHIVPITGNTYGLGSAAKAFNNIFVNSVGEVVSDGTADTPFPYGWSSSRISTGLYRVTHYLGTNNYTVVANAISSTAKFCNVYVKSSDYFEIRIVNFAGSVEDNFFSFMVLRNPNG